MPIYEYVCKKCGHHLEIIQKMSDKPLSRCRECRGRLEKVISQTSFHLKGSGWYVSDYGKGGAKEKTDAPVKTDSIKTTGATGAEKAEKAESSDKPAKPDRSDKPDKPTKKEATASSTSGSAGSTTKSGD